MDGPRCLDCMEVQIESISLTNKPLFPFHPYFLSNHFKCQTDTINVDIKGVDILGY